uniref:Solute carrier family 45 member 2 n=1 Tax=Astyanax mexicanus TaxID=7994 RepID=A0A8B9H727_ASTMX
MKLKTLKIIGISINISNTGPAFTWYQSAVFEAVEPPRRSRGRLVMHGLVMFGREFCYAVEAAFVTPVLLSVGLPRSMYSLVWLISPVLGFILQPVIGSASDYCRSPWGRRRPYILSLGIMMLVGITMFLNGDAVVSGKAFIFINFYCKIILLISGKNQFYDFIHDLKIKKAFPGNLYVFCYPAGLGGAFGYLIGAMDWGHSALGVLLGSEYQVIYFFSAITWGFFLTVHLFSIPETPLKKQQHTSESTAPTAPLILASNGTGYGALPKDPVPAPEIRPRSFSALSEANAVTSSAKQPSKEVSSLARVPPGLHLHSYPNSFTFTAQFVLQQLSHVYLLITAVSTLSPVLSHVLCPYGPALVYEHRKQGKEDPSAQGRGTGVDCAALTCMVQLAQIIVGAGLGALVNLAGSVVVVVLSASTMALIGCLFIAVFIRHVD